MDVFENHRGRYGITSLESNEVVSKYREAVNTVTK
jgi:hypothetical protein